jgi:hypothetical protein
VLPVLCTVTAYRSPTPLPSIPAHPHSCYRTPHSAPIDIRTAHLYTYGMRTYLQLLPTFGLLIAALLLAAVMADSAGYRWCDQHSDPQCVSMTGSSPGSLK